MDFVNCKVARYHIMKILESPYTTGSSVQKETCTSCHENFVYMFLPNGQQANPQRYFNDHIRYFAQPIEEDPGMMAAFLHCNPKAAKRMAEAKTADEKHKWFQQEMNEKFRWAIKKALNNEGWTDKGDFDGLNRSSRTK